MRPGINKEHHYTQRLMFLRIHSYMDVRIAFSIFCVQPIHILRLQQHSHHLVMDSCYFCKILQQLIEAINLAYILSLLNVYFFHLWDTSLIFGHCSPFKLSLFAFILEFYQIFPLAKLSLLKISSCSFCIICNKVPFTRN